MVSYRWIMFNNCLVLYVIHFVMTVIYFVRLNYVGSPQFNTVLPCESLTLKLSRCDLRHPFQNLPIIGYGIWMDGSDYTSKHFPSLIGNSAVLSWAWMTIVCLSCKRLLLDYWEKTGIYNSAPEIKENENSSSLLLPLYHAHNINKPFIIVNHFSKSWLSSLYSCFQLGYLIETFFIFESYIKIQL